MDAAQEVHDRRTRLHGRPIREPGHAHHPGRCLHGDVHRQLVGVRPRQPITGARRVHQARIELVQDCPAHAQAIHHSGRVVLEQHIGRGGQLAQNRLALFGLQIQRDALLVAVQQSERNTRALAHRLPLPNRLAARRLHLDDECASLGHQVGRIGALIDLPEIDHHDPVQRAVASLHVGYLLRLFECARPATRSAILVCAARRNQTGIPLLGIIGLRGPSFNQRGASRRRVFSSSSAMRRSRAYWA